MIHHVELDETQTKKFLWYLRWATAPWRALPDFIIIGAQKCGTTTLFDLLEQHPLLAPSYKKEIHYFDGGLDPRIDTFKKGLSWYRGHFPLKSGKLTFEASPLYLFNSLCAERIKRAVPDVKLIVLLRNPTDRAISHYFHSLRAGDERLGIAEALKSEERRLERLIQEKNTKIRPSFTTLIKPGGDTGSRSNGI